MEDTVKKRNSCSSTVGRAFKGEFKLRNFGFSGANYTFFPFAQWMWMDVYVYPIYRILISTSLLVWTCVEVPLEFQQNKKVDYFLYATNWAFLIYAFSSNIFAIFCTYFNCNKEKKIPQWFTELLWFFYGMSMNTVLVTSLVYWAAFWDPSYSEFYQIESKFKHLMPASTVLMDAWINGLPIRLFHAIYPSTFGITYALFSFLYYGAGNLHPIYPVLDWSKPVDATSTSFLIITISLLIQMVEDLTEDLLFSHLSADHHQSVWLVIPIKGKTVLVFLFLLYVGRITLSAHLGGRGVEVVEEWWKGSSEVSSKVSAVDAFNYVLEHDIEAGK